MKIGIAIPNYNREGELTRAFEQVYHDPRVEVITIADDDSSEATRLRLRSVLFPLKKVYFAEYSDNLGCYLNKARALKTVDRLVPWNLLLDSDNAIAPRVLDALERMQPWDRHTLYMPSWAMPVHDYRAYSGQSYTHENIAPMMDAARFQTALNTGNFFVHREAFAEVFDKEADPKAADSMFFVTSWLRAGRTIHFVPDFHYMHQFNSQDSNYDRYAKESQPIFAALAAELREMR